MAYYAYANNFAAFFRRLNPSLSFEQQASSHYGSIKALIEDRTGLAGILSPQCFLQGSYRQQTAIYTINDVDIVALCELWQPGNGVGSSWDRDEIFAIVAAPLLKHGRYRDKVRYRSDSMCIKVDLGVKVEILPVVYKAGISDAKAEPFRLFRPETGQWEDGYARYHQQWLSWKNGADKTGGNFIPAVKVFKHLRSYFAKDAVSFHIECLLFSLPDALFRGGPAEYVPALLSHLSARPASDWWLEDICTPCGDRDIFTATEWQRESWGAFHELIATLAPLATAASRTTDWEKGVMAWQLVLGAEFFPKAVSG